MTIKKSYRFQIEDEDGYISEAIIKGKTPQDAREAFMQEYPDLYWHDFGERLKTPRGLRDHFKGPFWNSCRRGAQYIYQHKGRKKRNRKNYPTPKGGWRRPIRMHFTFTETVSTSMRNFLKSWCERVALATLPESDGPFTIENMANRHPPEAVMIGEPLVGEYGVSFNLSFFQDPTPDTESDMQSQQTNDKTVPAIVFDSMMAHPDVAAEYEKNPPCVSADAVDELGRAVADLRIGDTVVTRMPTLAEQAAAADPNTPLGRALQCAALGDTTGMMLNAAEDPEVMQHLVAKGLVDVRVSHIE